jgi:hypothetical protein
LVKVGSNAERDPWRGISLGLVATTLNLLEDRVVPAGALTEILLDRTELWRQEPIASEDERLRDSGDSSVSIAEWVDGNNVQVCHRSAHGHVDFTIAVLEPIDDFFHQAGHIFMRWSLVSRRTAVPARYVDRPLAPKAGPFVALEVAGVEMEIQDDPVEPVKVCVHRHDPNVIHRTGIRGHGHPVIVLRAGYLVSGDEGSSLSWGHDEPFDRDRAFDRTRPHLAS